MAIRVVTQPESEPLSVEEVKDILRIDSTDDDLVLQAMITQAREWCEDYQGKKYITQTLDLVMDYFPDVIEFKDCSPVQSITSVSYIDTVGVEHTLNSETYILDKESFVARVVPAYNCSWPDDLIQPVNGVVIRFVAGYGTASNVPETVKQAIVLHIKTLYDDMRAEDVDRTEKAKTALLGMRRVVKL